MSYPGNPSASADVRKRVREAFRHSVSSAVEGRRDDALLGCDFILRLDEAFEPAARLQQMLEQDRPPEEIQELLGAEGEPEGAGAGTPPAQAPSPPTGATYSTSTSPALVATFQRLLEARRFEELLSAAQAQAAAVAGSSKLQDLVATAQARFESEPFVREVLDKCREALGRGQLDLVQQLLAKAKGLDASHPGVAEIERLSASAATLSNSLTIDWDDDTPAATAVRGPEEARTEPAPLPTSSGFETDPGVRAAAPSAPQADASDAPVEAFSEVPPDLDLPDLDFAIVEPEAGDQASAATPADEPEPATDFQAPDAEPEPSFGDEPADEDVAEEGDDRVRSLLGEGQTAFDQGDYQAAIDSWSRIFLIDIDNEEAASRIERARQLKAEHEREVEEVFHEGVARFDAGDWDAAREAFERVLADQPSYVLAREYLDRIDERAAGGDVPGADLPEMAPLPSADEPADRSSRLGGAPRGEEILVPPDPGAATGETRAPAVGGFAVTARRRALPEPKFLAIGGGVLLLLAIGGYFLATNWKSFFPNAGESVATGASASQAVLDRAQKLQKEGKAAQAIAQLKRIPPQDPAYAEAQSLVSQWEKLEEPAGDTGPAPEELARRADLVQRARDAVDVGDHFLAQRLLDQASTVVPLNPAEVDLRAVADAAARQYDDVLGLMKDGEFEMALNRLWRRHEQNPDDRDVRRLMVDSYYNLSIADLQRGDPSAARSKAKEALTLDPDDAELIRLERFASTYEKRDRDLLYRIFVKYLHNR